MKKILLLLILFLCSSCYDYQEVNDLAIVSGMAIDYIDDNYYLTYEVINTKNDKEDTNSYTYTSSGNTISLAIENINKMIPKKVSLSHLDIVIISKSLANHGLYNISDYFFRNNKITTNFYLVMSNINPKNILENKSENYQVNSIAIKNILKENKIDIHEQFDYLISYIMDNSKNIVIPSVKLDNNIIIDNYAMFKGDKFYSYLDEEDNKVFKLLKNKGKITYDINDTNINIKNNKTSVYVDDKKYIINIKTLAYIEEKNMDVNYNLLEELAKKELKEKINNFILKELDNDIDILGFKKIYHIKHPNDLIENYKLPVEINVEFKIDDIGYVR
ncbi:MAG: Ger(x)C family spore germination protein [Bacilli bacterium]|nr:Ger(x)C family spore germination protein [Bacilli bacterium]